MRTSIFKSHNPESISVPHPNVKELQERLTDLETLKKDILLNIDAFDSRLKHLVNSAFDVGVFCTILAYVAYAKGLNRLKSVEKEVNAKLERTETALKNLDDLDSPTNQFNYLVPEWQTL